MLSSRDEKLQMRSEYYEKRLVWEVDWCFPFHWVNSCRVDGMALKRFGSTYDGVFNPNWVERRDSP